MLRELRRLRPDVVYLNTFFNPVFAIAPLVARRFGLLSGTRFVVAPRGEFSPGALGLKASKKSRFLRAFLRSGAGRHLTWHATSDLEADAIRTALGGVEIAVAPVLRAMAPPAEVDPDAAVKHEGPLRVVLLLAPNALRQWVKDFVAAPQDGLTLMFESFGFRHGIPLDADLVFDVRSLPNPHYDPALRPLTGMDAAVVDFMKNTPDAQRMLEDIRRFVDNWLPSFRRDNRSYLTVAIGCTGGRHRSVYFVETLAKAFRPSAQVLVRHRGLSPQ